MESTKPKLLLVGAHLLATQISEIFRHQGVSTEHIAPNEVRKTRITNTPAIVWTTNNKDALLTALHLKKRGCRPHRYWIGGDVLRLSTTSPVKRRTLAVFNRILFDSHTANSAWLSAELMACGIDSRPLPFSPVCCDQHWRLSPAPAAYTVLFYSHEDNDHIYMPEHVFRAARNLPETQFICVGDSKLKSTLPNVEIVGEVPRERMIEIYKQSSCLIRFTSHDGFPRMIIEAMALGLDVVSNLPIPLINRVETPDEITACIAKLANSPPKRNLDLREYAFSQQSAQNWCDYWTKLTS